MEVTLCQQNYDKKGVTSFSEYVASTNEELAKQIKLLFYLPEKSDRAAEYENWNYSRKLGMEAHLNLQNDRKATGNFKDIVNALQRGESVALTLSFFNHVFMGTPDTTIVLLEGDKATIITIEDKHAPSTPYGCIQALLYGILLSDPKVRMGSKDGKNIEFYSLLRRAGVKEVKVFAGINYYYSDDPKTPEDEPIIRLVSENGMFRPDVKPVVEKLYRIATEEPKALPRQ